MDVDTTEFDNEPETLQSAKKLLELAQKVNSGQPINSFHNENSDWVSRRSKDLEYSDKSNFSESGYNISKPQLGSAPKSSSKKYSNLSIEHCIGNNTNSGKRIDSIDVRLRHNINSNAHHMRSSAGSATIAKNTVSFKVNEIEYHSNRHSHEAHKKPVPNPDDRPIRQANFADLY